MSPTPRNIFLSQRGKFQSLDDQKGTNVMQPKVTWSTEHNLSIQTRGATAHKEGTTVDNVDMFPFKDDPFTKLCVSASEQ